MKTIKGPSKTFPMAIGQGNMDKTFIEKRKYFLQEYLRHVSIKIDQKVHVELLLPCFVLNVILAFL